MFALLKTARDLTVGTVQRFRGVNRFATIPNVTPDYALDCRNVIVGTSGGLSKLRVPVALSPQIAGAEGPERLFYFAQGDGLREVIGTMGTSLYRFDTDALTPTLIENAGDDGAPWDFATSNNICFGANGQRMMKWTGSAWQNWGIQAPVNAPALGAPVAGALTLQFGRSYRYAYGNSVTGHIGSASPASAGTGAITSKNVPVTASAPSPADGQIDTIYWYSTLDGGGDYYLNTSLPIGSGLAYTDSVPDAELNTAVVCQLINNPPPVGKYLAKSGGRIFVAGIQGAPQDVAYSGYEQILTGRPEESFPPSNRLRMAIGADAVRGLGILQAGIVIFGESDQMWMLKGIIEDITTNAPVIFSETLEQLPWNLGCASHYTIQSTPVGLIWLASDHSVQRYDGTDVPEDIGKEIYPVLRTITPGAEESAQGAFLNWLEREWYVLAIPTEGATQPNLIAVFDLEPNPEINAGIFLFDIGTVGSLAVIEDSNGQRKLVVGQNGQILQLAVGDTTANGIADPETSTTATLDAWWQSAYYGADDPQYMKLFRWGDIVADNPGLGIQLRLVDDAGATVSQPRVVPAGQLAGSRFGVGQKARRMSVEIDFPSEDMDFNVLEASVAYIPTSVR